MDYSLKLQEHMNRQYKLTHQVVAYLLLINLFLQSCTGTSNQVLPRVDSINQSGANLLVDQELVLEKGALVTFHDNDGELQADIKVASSPKPIYRGLPIVIEEGTNLAELPKLSPKTQECRIQLDRSQSGQPNRVFIFKGGISGGMMEGDDYQEKEKKDESKKNRFAQSNWSRSSQISSLSIGKRELQIGIKKSVGLAYDYQQGEKGAEKQNKEDIQELEEYAQSGNIEAQFRLGEKYYAAWQQQQDVEDVEKAKKWLEKAAAKGHQVAIALLERINFAPRPFRLEDQSEGEKEAAVASMWNANSLPNLPEDHARQELANDILATTGAEADVRLNVYYQLQQALTEHLEKDGELRGEWNGLWHYLKEPELLVDEDAYAHRKSAINEELATQVFHSFKAVQDRLLVFQGKLLQQFPHHPEWIKALEKVANFYDNFQAKVCQVWKDGEQFHAMIEPKALLMGEWWPHTFYRISQRQARYLLGRDKHGHMIAPLDKGESTSNHHVSFLPVEDPTKAAVYFKTNGMPALNPSREYMLYSLYRNLDIEVPASGLLMIDHVKFGETYHNEPFILQASQAVVGSIGKKVLKEGNKLVLDAEHYAKQVIGALLTGPVDGKADNYIVKRIGEAHGWVGIDNDEVFQAPILDSRVHFKSILLLLNEMSGPLHPALRILFTCLHPSLLLLEWLVDLQNQEANYEVFKKTLIDHGTNYRYIRKGGSLSPEHIEGIWQELSLPFSSFYSSIIPTVSYLLRKIQTHLKDNRTATLVELFTCCYPRISASYQFLQETSKNQPYEALRKLYASEAKDLPPLLELDDNKGPEEELYFKEDTTQVTMGERIRLYLNQTSELHVDEVIKSYASWLHQGKDRVTQQTIFQKALNSLQMVTHYGFKQVEEVPIAIDFYVKGFELLSTDTKQQDWVAVFEELAKENPDLAWHLTLERYFPRGWNHTQPEPQSCEEIRGARLGKRKLSVDMRQVLFDRGGNFQANKQLSGRSLSTYYPTKSPLFFFKKYPELPAYEYAATSFMRHLGLKDAPRSELLVFYNPKEGLYPVLLTQAIAGDPVFKVWNEDNNFSQLDSYATSLLILASMLLNPEDSKEDNFILSPDKKQLIPIDNDHVFLPGAIEAKGKLGFKIIPQLQTKTLAFCLSAMYQPFDEKLVQHISSLNVDRFLEKWLHELNQVNELYQHVLPEKQLANLWSKHGSSLRLPLTSLYIQGLYRKFYLLRTMLIQNRNIKPIELLKRLEPYVGKFYEEVASLSSVQDRFKAVSKVYEQGHIKGVRMSVANSQRLMEIMHVSNEELTASITRCKQNPTAALEQLKQLQKDKGIQEDRIKEMINGTIEDSKVSQIALKDEEILIHQWFESEESYDWIMLPYSEKLQNRHLTSFQFQNKGTLLRALDLRGAKQMGEVDFMALHNYCPNLGYLNISEWKIKKLGYFKQGRLFNTNLELSSEPIFPCLERLVASNCQVLKTIVIELPSLQSLEAIGNTKLTKFWLRTPVLKLLDLSRHKIKDKFYIDINLLAKPRLKGLSPCAKQIIEGLNNQSSILNLASKQLNNLDISLLINHPYFKQKLHVLDLGRNQIGASGVTKLVDFLPNTQIHTLNLSWNLIGASGAIKLAEALPNTQIHTLNLSENRIFAEGATKLAKALPYTRIHTLNLSSNKIGDSGVMKLSKALPHTQIHTLDLTGNEIGYSGVTKLSKALPHTQVHTLYLSTNQIGDEGVIKLSEALANAQLYTLYLGSNKIGASGAIKLSEALPHTQIHTLDLSASFIGREEVINLIEALPNTQIHTLNLSWNLIGASGAIKLSKTLPNTQLHTLNLAHNRIDDSGVTKLAEALPKSQLHTLDLSSNLIWQDGATKLADALPHTQIHTLDLSSNQIGQDEAIKLSEILPYTQLHTIDLGSNRIGDSGAIKLSEVLPNTQIHTLDLGSNEIGDSGAIKLAEALYHSQLHTLDLSENKIGDSGASKLSEVLPNTQIHTLDLSGNQIGAEMQRLLKQKNPNIKFKF